jgi:hypothetical protein
MIMASRWKILDGVHSSTSRSGSRRHFLSREQDPPQSHIVIASSLLRAPELVLSSVATPKPKSSISTVRRRVRVGNCRHRLTVSALGIIATFEGSDPSLKPLLLWVYPRGHATMRPLSRDCC